MQSSVSETSSYPTTLYEVLLRVMERYGFGAALSLVILWFVRTDLVLPIVASHQVFLVEMAATQREISKSVGEQTRLLYALQPRAKDGPGGGEP
jgi:hypothetical protein